METSEGHPLKIYIVKQPKQPGGETFEAAGAAGGQTGYSCLTEKCFGWKMLKKQKPQCQVVGFLTELHLIREYLAKFILMMFDIFDKY